MTVDDPGRCASTRTAPAVELLLLYSGLISHHEVDDGRVIAISYCNTHSFVTFKGLIINFFIDFWIRSFFWIALLNKIK